MSSPEPSGRSRPLRIAGLALLGIAVGAVLVGLITLGGQRGGDGGDGGTAAPTTGAPTDATTTATTTADTSTVPTEAPPVTTTEAPPPPPPTTAEPTAEPAPPAPEPTAPIRVYNNSFREGLAAEAAEDFRRFGWVVDDVGNHQGRIPTSTVYYRPGTDEEAAARRLGRQFNLRVEPRFDGIAGAPPGLIVIVTEDYGSK